MRYRTAVMALAVLAAGLVGWSCSSDPGGAAKPQPPKSGAAEKPAPTATEKSAPTATGQPAVTATEKAPAATETAASNGKIVPIRFTLFPKIKVLKTPIPTPAGPNIAPPDGKPRPPVMVPEGTANLALGKPVTSNATSTVTGSLSLVTDGEKEFVEGCWLELGPGKKWIQIDLGASSRICAIAVWRWYGLPIAYHDVVIQVADDADFIDNVRTVFNSDFDNSSGQGIGNDLEHIENYLGQVVQTQGIVGRYVRLYSNGNTVDGATHYVEVEVYGKPAK